MSVVVPVYNRRQLIERALRSLVKQDCQFPYEIVVVDDGSTDGTAESVEELEISNVTVVRQANQGAAAARHAGVTAARADVVVFQDSDDIARPCKLRVLYEALQQYPEAVAAYALTGQTRDTSKHWVLSGEEEFDVFWKGPQDGARLLVSDALALQLRAGYPLFGGVNIAARRDIALAASQGRGFYKAANDLDLSLRLAARGPFVGVREWTCTAVYGNELLDSVSITRQDIYSEFALVSITDLLNSAEASEELKSAACAGIERHWGHALLRALQQRSWWWVRRVLLVGFKYVRPQKAPRLMWWAYAADSNRRRTAKRPDAA